MLAAWLKNHLTFVRFCIFFASALPGAYLLYAFFTDDLGSNPLELLTHVTGRTSLIFLILTLSITPLRKILTNISQRTHRRYGKRLSDWNWLVRLRRMLGLWCFAYGMAHFFVFLEFDLAYDWPILQSEILEKPYLLVGALALLLLVPLAVTSTQGMIKRLGKNWLRLHMLVYPIALLALLHFWWLVKPGVLKPLPETLALTYLLGYRLFIRLGMLEKWDGFDGLETKERQRVR